MHCGPSLPPKCPVLPWNGNFVGHFSQNWILHSQIVANASVLVPQSPEWFRMALQWLKNHFNMHFELHCLISLPCEAVFNSKATHGDHMVGSHLWWFRGSTFFVVQMCFKMVPYDRKPSAMHIFTSFLRFLILLDHLKSPQGFRATPRQAVGVPPKIGEKWGTRFQFLGK